MSYWIFLWLIFVTLWSTYPAFMSPWECGARDSFFLFPPLLQLLSRGEVDLTRWETVNAIIPKKRKEGISIAKRLFYCDYRFGGLGLDC